MIYIKSIIRQLRLKEGSNITFKLSDGSVYNGIVTCRERYYINLRKENNGKIFSLLDIKDKFSFVSNIVNYSVRTGDWPYVITLEDLDKVLHALLKVNKPEEQTEEKTEEIEKQSPSEWDWLL